MLFLYALEGSSAQTKACCDQLPTIAMTRKTRNGIINTISVAGKFTKHRAIQKRKNNISPRTYLYNSVFLCLRKKYLGRLIKLKKRKAPRYFEKSRSESR